MIKETGKNRGELDQKTKEHEIHLETSEANKIRIRKKGNEVIIERAQNVKSG